MTLQTDIAAFIQQTPLVDTHEHMRGEESYLEESPDILGQLFQNYVPADLFVAGASKEALDKLLDSSDPDVAARFAPVQEAWARVQHTGYGEAVSIIANDLYGIEELTPDSIAAAQEKNTGFLQPGERLRLLRDEANLDHIQTDAFTIEITPDRSGPDFFFYDISWAEMCTGQPNHEEIAKHTGLEVSDLTSLRRVMETIFQKFSTPAIAVKSQHAYNRTLRWQERSDDEAAKALDIYLRDGKEMDAAAKLCLGDWCWARGVELCIEHDLPMKLHTGYYAGHSRMPRGLHSQRQSLPTAGKVSLTHASSSCTSPTPTPRSWSRWPSIIPTSTPTSVGPGASTPTAQWSLCAALSMQHLPTSCSSSAAIPVTRARPSPTPRQARHLVSPGRCRQKSPRVC